MRHLLLFGAYGEVITSGVIVGAFSTLFVDHLRSRKEHKKAK